MKVCKFEGFYQIVIKMNQSGQTHEDHITQAMLLYKNATGNTKKESFPYLSSWERLRRHPKWGMNPSKADSSLKRKRGENFAGDESFDKESTSVDYMEGDTVTRSGGRPVGSKEARAMKANAGESEIVQKNIQRLAIASEKKAEALIHLNQLQSVKLLFTSGAGSSMEEIEEVKSLLREKTLLSLRQGNKPEFAVLLHWLSQICITIYANFFSYP
tara:strand:+ start:479 stop:1123 length:645 start_codon:yes stop_codon:yes gene_type:complete